MGSSSSKPEFSSVLADKQVKHGETVILCCKANTASVKITWKKDDKKLLCVNGKHFTENNGTEFSLKIVNAQENDEGKYTLYLRNTKGGISCSSRVRVELREWRKMVLNQHQLLNTLKEFNICNKVPELRFLLYGPVGTGKSSTINTIRTIFSGRQFIECLAAALSERSHTKCFDRFEVPKENGSFPFAFYDIMGLQASKGLDAADVISALKGHMKVGYVCNPIAPLSQNSLYYLKNPTLSDQMHCLLCIIPADKFELMGIEFLVQFKAVSEAARAMEVPQVVLMTRIDLACMMTRHNLRNVFKSKTIRNKMSKCSDILGVPVNRIFPVWNYHEETYINEDINCLMLEALTSVVFWANDYVKQKA